MKIPVCRLEYHKFGTSGLDTFASEVKNGVYTNTTVFASPPVSEANFIAFQGTFSDAAADYAQYGLTKKVAFLATKEVLIDALDSLATYVDSVALGNVSTIALSGFIPTSVSVQPSAPLDKIDTFEVSLSKSTGEIVVDIPAYANQSGVNYNCICVEGAALSNPALINGQIVLHANDPMVRQDFNRTRRKVFGGLTPGIKYFFYVFATNSVSVSPLSNPQSIYVS